MFEHLNPASFLIAAAVSTYVIGFLFRDQIYTRLLVALGSGLYATYYLNVNETPLWDAAAGSTLIALASLQGVLVLWWSRSAWAIPKADSQIFEVIGNIEPGLFRQLMRAADRVTTKEATELVIEGQPPSELWYLVSGEVVVKRKGRDPARIVRPGFIGEIAWLTKGEASATVVAPPGSVLLRWNEKDLRRKARRSHRLELALDALIAQDLAAKLATSDPIEQDLKTVSVEKMCL